MKKYMALLMILAVLASSIFFIKDYNNQKDVYPTLDSTNLQVPPEEHPSLNSAASTEKDICFCELPAVFDSIQELVSALRTGTCETSNGTYSLQSIKQKMDSVYVPAAIPEGFVLYEVVLNEYVVSYFYVQEEYADKSMISSANGFVIDFSLEPTNTESNSLSIIADYYDIPINEEGFVYSPEDNVIFFAPGNAWISITVPDSMNNYDTLKSLCVAERVSINTEVA